MLVKTPLILWHQICKTIIKKTSPLTFADFQNDTFVKHCSASMTQLHHALLVNYLLFFSSSMKKRKNREWAFKTTSICKPNGCMIHDFMINSSYTILVILLQISEISSTGDGYFKLNWLTLLTSLQSNYWFFKPSKKSSPISLCVSIWPIRFRCSIH